MAISFEAEAGYRVVAVSDSRGGVANGRGLDVAGLIAFKQETGTVAGKLKELVIVRTSQINRCEY